MREIYLDNNATTQPLPEVREAMLEVLGTDFGNPSSAHERGGRGRRALERSRAAVAQLVGSREEQVIFTGSGTEANNLVLLSSLSSVRQARLVTTQIEHSSILKTADYLETQGCEVVRLPVDGGGRLDLDDLASVLSPKPDLVTIQWVNNETGVIQPIGEIAALCRERDIPFHTDAAQAVGKIPIDFAKLPVTHLTCTAHKLHGPAGTGALITRKKAGLKPLVYGGPQEFGLRAGTENLPGIVGFGVAAACRYRRFDSAVARLASLRDRFEHRMLSNIPDVSINGDKEHRVSNSSNLRSHGTDGQALVARLDRIGIRCSQSSACTNQRPEPSYVLQAMGLTEDEAYSSVRFSVSEMTTKAEVDRAADLIAKEVETLRDLFGYEGAA